MVKNKDGKDDGLVFKPIRILLLLGVLAMGVVGTLVYVGIVDIPVVTNVLDAFGLTSATSDAPTKATDADEYFEEADVAEKINVEDSKKILSEAEVSSLLFDLGFDTYPITADYSIGGEYYGDTEISDSSSEVHPMYQTYYTTDSGDVWIIMIIDGDIMAMPLSYIFENEDVVPIIISEHEYITSYDSEENVFYRTVPDELVMTVKTVSKIDADEIERLTAEVLG